MIFTVINVVLAGIAAVALVAHVLSGAPGRSR
jgi:hypothetical protein